MTNEEEVLAKHIEKVLHEVYDEDGTTVNYANAKTHICEFYTGHTNCRGCKKTETRLEECVKEYSENIVARPQRNWDPSWDVIEVREKTPLSDIKNIGLGCDRCYLSDDCPLYKKKALCAVDWTTNIHELKPEKAIEAVIEIQSERIQRARAIEALDGGVPDQNLSMEIDRLSGLIATKADMESDKFSLKIEASAKSSGGSILEKFFGGGMNKQVSNNEPIRIEEGTAVELPPVATANDAIPIERTNRNTPKKVAKKR
jgi:hypothetical protein